MTPYPWRELAELQEAHHQWYLHGGGDRPILMAKRRAYLAAVDAWRAKGGEKPEPPVSTTPACDCRDGLVTAPSGRDMLCPKCHPNPAPERTCEEILVSLVNQYPHPELLHDALAAHRSEVAAITEERDELKARIERAKKYIDSPDQRWWTTMFGILRGDHDRP